MLKMLKEDITHTTIATTKCPLLLLLIKAQTALVQGINVFSCVLDCLFLRKMGKVLEEVIAGRSVFRSGFCCCCPWRSVFRSSFCCCCAWGSVFRRRPGCQCCCCFRCRHWKEDEGTDCWKINQSHLTDMRASMAQLLMILQPLTSIWGEAFIAWVKVFILDAAKFGHHSE